MGPEIELMAIAVAIAWLACVGVILGARRVAPEIGLMDRPGLRHQHARTTPVVGGIGIVAGFLAAVAMLDWHVGPFDSLLAGVALLAVVGVVDDIWGLRAMLRLSAQFVAVLIVVILGDLQVHYLGDLLGFGPIGLWIFSVPFTALCIMLMINAVNMLDGIDGLAGGLSLVMLLGFSLLLGLDGRVSWLLPLLLAVAVAGFLVFNMPTPWRRHATVFMGDCGSTVLGFALAWLAIFVTQPSSASVPPVAVAWILILPAVDALSLFFRRMMDGRSPFSADRWHLQHILVRAGYPKATTVWTLIRIQAGLVLIGVGGWWAGLPEWLLFYPLATGFVVYQVVFWRGGRVLRYLGRKAKETGVRSQGSGVRKGPL